MNKNQQHTETTTPVARQGQSYVSGHFVVIEIGDDPYRVTATHNVDTVTPGDVLTGQEVISRAAPEANRSG